MSRQRHPALLALSELLDDDPIIMRRGIVMRTFPHCRCSHRFNCRNRIA